MSETFDFGRINSFFLLMLGLSLGIGIYAGSQAGLNIKLLFYIIALTNSLMVAYLFLLKDMSYGLLLYFYALIFLSLYWRIPLPGKFPDLDPPRIIFTFFWVMFLLDVGLGNKRLLPRTPAETAMVAMIIAIVISMIQHRVDFIRNLLNGYAIPYAMFMVSKHVFATKRDIRKLLYFGAVPLSIYFPLNHIFERLGMEQFVFPRYITSEEVGGRLLWAGERTIGAFLQPVATGFAIICMFLLSLYALSKLRGFLPRLFSVVICILTPIAVFIIYTRSVYLGFAVALIIIAVFGRRLRKYAVVILVAALLAVMANWDNVTGEDRSAGGLATKSTALGRLALLQSSMKMFADRPFTGVGFDKYMDYRLTYIRQVRQTLLGMRESWMGKSVKQHSQFLLVLTELGLMGFVPLCLIYYFIIRMLWRARKVHDDAFDYEFVVVVSAILAEYLVNAMFMNPSFFEFLNVMPMVLAGIVAGGYQRAVLGKVNNGFGERSLAGEGSIR